MQEKDVIRIIKAHSESEYDMIGLKKSQLTNAFIQCIPFSKTSPTPAYYEAV